MAEYYVVRDKNTGLYFRGKGVNRWGKYYNQASIYRIRANAENTIKEVSWRGEQAEIVPIQIIESTADVVPMSEVDELKQDLEISKIAIENRNIEIEGMRTAANSYKMHYEKARGEVARQIFEEIEELAKIYTFPVVKNGVVEIAKEPFWCIEPNDLAKLKKKYTEKTE